MYSKVIILLWERWQRSRWAVIGFCLLLLTELLSHVPEYYSLGKGLKNLYFPGFIIFIAILLIGQCEARHLDLAFPKRLFRFPVKTATLFIIYMGYGLAVTALPFVLLYGVGNLLFDNISFQWTPFLLFETVYVVIQALSWLGGPARFLWVALALMLVYTFQKIADILGFSMETDILCPIIILLCCIISFWSVSKYRHGGWLNNWKWASAFFCLFRNKHTNTFKSPMHAQIWYEVRRTGYLFPLIIPCCIGPFLGHDIYWLLMGSPPSNLSQYIPSILFFSIILAWLPGMIAFAIYYRDNASGASRFILRRPIKTQNLALARQYATVISITRALAILVFFIFILLLYDWTIGSIKISLLKPVFALAYKTPFENLIVTVTGLYSIVVVYWILLRQPLIPPLCLLLMVFYTFLTKVGELEAWTYVGNTLIAVPVLIVIAFYIARRRNLVSSTTLAILIFLFPVILTSLWSFPWGFGPNRELMSLNHWQIIRLICASAIPFIPLVSTPLLMDRLRHS